MKASEWWNAMNPTDRHVVLDKLSLNTANDFREWDKLSFVVKNALIIHYSIVMDVRKQMEVTKNNGSNKKG